MLLTSRFEPQVSLLNVKYVLSARPLMKGDLIQDEASAVCASDSGNNLSFSAYGTQLISHGEKGGVWIYENANALPRAYLVHHAEVVPDERLLNSLRDIEEFNYN